MSCFHVPVLGLKGTMRDLRGYHGGQMKPTNIQRINGENMQRLRYAVKGDWNKRDDEGEINRNYQMDIFMYNRKKF
jgi:hypothetical protein